MYLVILSHSVFGATLLLWSHIFLNYTSSCWNLLICLSLNSYLSVLSPFTCFTVLKVEVFYRTRVMPCLGVPYKWFRNSYWTVVYLKHKTRPTKQMDSNLKCNSTDWLDVVIWMTTFLVFTTPVGIFILSYNGVDIPGCVHPVSKTVICPILTSTIKIYS